MTKRTLFLAFITLFLLSSCGSRKKTQYKPKNQVNNQIKPNSKTTKEEVKIKTKADKPLTRTEQTLAYIEAYKNIAIHEMQTSKIPASITIAQGILESGSGQGTLALNANNHFGIKCHDWKGEGVYHDDDELQECFRKYNDPSESFKDHSIFLTGRSRYSKLFEFDPKDYRSWAYGLKAAGYATDPKYPDKLISIIERYELYKLDGTDNVWHQPTPVNSDKIHYVKKGDTLYSIAKTYGTTIDRLKQLNQLDDNNISIGQNLIIDKN